MPRRREVPKRNILPDPKFGSQEVSKFVNVLMTGGKKSVAERILYGAFDQIAQKSGKDALEVFTTAIGNLRPVVEVKSRRVGGANYRCRLRCVLLAAARWPCAGCAMPPASVARSPWDCALLLSWSKPPRVAALP